jgi:prepilin-type N-terminal cleavage/methylation domain-containing protein
MRNDNRGFTLVELIVSIAILSIIAVAAAGFLLAGTRTYTGVNYSVRLQYESQIAMNQLQTYIMNCNAGAAFDKSSNTLYVADRDVDGKLKVNVFKLDGENLLFANKDAVQEAVVPGSDKIFAEGVQSINVEFKPGIDKNAKTGNAGSAVVTITMERGGKSYSGEQTIALRNEPLIAANWADLWSGLNPAQSAGG